MTHNVTGYKAQTHYPMNSQFRGMKAGTTNTSYTKNLRPDSVNNGEQKLSKNMTLEEQLKFLDQQAEIDSVRAETIAELENEAKTAKENEFTKNMLK